MASLSLDLGGGIPATMAIDQQRLMELCERASREQHSKKLRELTQQIDQLITEASEAWELVNPSATLLNNGQHDSRHRPVHLDSDGDAAAD